MHLPRLVTGAGAVLLIAGLAAPAANASDDDSPPLYVYHNGQRVPTMIIPPKVDAPPRRVELIQFGPAPAQPPPDQQQEDPDAMQPPFPEAEQGWAHLGEVEDDPLYQYYLERVERDRPYFGPLQDDGLGFRSAISLYAGYPVSMLHGYSPGWSYYDTNGGFVRSGDRLTYPAQVLQDMWDVERQERARRFNVEDMNRRAAKVLASHERALSLGLAQLRGGEYSRAVITLKMAAELNQGDPAARIHLGQALLARGQYDEAADAVRRALELQPKLAYAPLDLPSYYGTPEAFDAHVDALLAWLRANRARAEVYFLLGYLEFQREDHAEAYRAFRMARRGLQRDSLTESFLKITRPQRMNTARDTDMRR